MKQQTEPMHPILAKFHEAKQAGFEWADDAIAAFDEGYAQIWAPFWKNKKIKYHEAVFYGMSWGANFKWNHIHKQLESKGL